MSFLSHLQKADDWGWRAAEVVADSLKLEVPPLSLLSKTLSSVGWGYCGVRKRI